MSQQGTRQQHETQKPREDENNPNRSPEKDSRSENRNQGQDRSQKTVNQTDNQQRKQEQSGATHSDSQTPINGRETSAKPDGQTEGQDNQNYKNPNSSHHDNNKNREEEKSSGSRTEERPKR
ncbi:MAG: hypothetical protein PVS2B2_13200 [Candidatus Acidiferrum sp.]